MTSDHIDPDLPWGCWFRIETERGERWFVHPSTGEKWRTIRGAFWNGRLGLPNWHEEPPSELLELIHAKLAQTARRKLPSEREETADLFQGSDRFRRMFVLWLCWAGLIEDNGRIDCPCQLTNEGWAALHMLAATRPYLVRQVRPSGPSVRQLTEVALGPEAREERLARVESIAANWDVAFLRRFDVGKHAIILSRRGDGPVPVLQTVWSLGFETEERRDNFYEWLCFRMDRWTAWGERANDYGAGELTHKLLEVMAGSLQPGQPQAPPPTREEHR